MKYAPRLAWAFGSFMYLVDVIQRANSPWPFTLHTADSIALLVSAGVAAIVWRPLK
jgi:hypothetical protein